MLDIPVRQPWQLNHFQQFLGFSAPGLSIDTAYAETIGDVFPRTQVRKQGQRLEHHTNVSLMGGNPSNVFAFERYRALGGDFQPRDQAQERGFTAARRSEERNEFTLGQIQVDIGDRSHGAVAFLNPAQGDAVHRMLPMPATDQWREGRLRPPPALNCQ